MDQSTRPLADILDRIVALLEIIAYQTSRRHQDIRPYLDNVYRRHAERNVDAAQNDEEGA